MKKKSDFLSTLHLMSLYYSIQISVISIFNIFAKEQCKFVRIAFCAVIASETKKRFHQIWWESCVPVLRRREVC